MTEGTVDPGDDPDPANDVAQQRPRPNRRAVLSGSLGAVGGAALGVTGTLWTRRSPAAAQPEAAAAEVPVFGSSQAGIARPGTPQQFGLLSIGDLQAPREPSFLPELGRRIAQLVANPPAGLLPDGAASLTVTVGVGPKVIAARHGDWPGAQPLPAFDGDGDVADSSNGGDLLLAAYADDPGVLPSVVHHLTAAVPGFRQRWTQQCFRGPGQGTIVRNPLGFHDGVTVPRSDQELAENVWLDGDLAGATVCVVRRLRLDVNGFHALPVDRREQVIGRKLDGAPLSGGAPFSDVNLGAKSPDGYYLVPTRAHARAAHPAFTGSRLMLRRGYSFDNGAGDAGLMFICFQRELRTFITTQHRLDDQDDLMQFVTPTGSGTFLILPGFDADRPLGRPLL